MEVCITEASRQAAAFLYGSSAGQIHSVYRRTINFTLEGRLFSLQAAGTVLSPISLITDLSEPEFAGLCAACKAGDPLSVRESRIALQTPEETVFFCCRKARCRDLRLAVYLPAGRTSSRMLTVLRQNIAAALSSESDGYAAIFSGLMPDDPILSAAKERIDKASSFFQANDLVSASESLAQLIGLGTGLTPGGDDFLCGVLAGLTLAGRTNHPFFHRLCADIRQNLSRTNDISAAFLSCAAGGEFSLPVISLVHLPDAGMIRESFGQVGHTSGFDTLYGIYFALTLQ